MSTNRKNGICGCLALPVGLYLCWIVISLVIFALSRNSISSVEALTLEKLASALCYPDRGYFAVYNELTPTVTSDVDFQRYMHEAEASRIPTDVRIETLMMLNKAVKDVSFEKAKTRNGLDCVTLKVSLESGGNAKLRFLVQPKQLWPKVSYAKVLQIRDGVLQTPNQNFVADFPGEALALMTALCSPEAFEP